ncbi:MAG: PD-(D/E)XK nuclease family protein [Armatimonadota bacterium]|nr:PD-(D/E)XK nuclease family protein [Armatimonadota bacterium]MDR5696267.1 PD-(D/E)XK nuclease family protein [Armatimonadota bacterium]
MARLSPSALTTYRACSKRYHLRHVLGLPARPCASLAMGGLVHEALRRLFALPAAQPVMLEGYVEARDDGLLFVARVDRVDPVGEGVRIVDYKTGSPPRHEDRQSRWRSLPRCTS